MPDGLRAGPRLIRSSGDDDLEDRGAEALKRGLIRGGEPLHARPVAVPGVKEAWRRAGLVQNASLNSCHLRIAER